MKAHTPDNCARCREERREAKIRHRQAIQRRIDNMPNSAWSRYKADFQKWEKTLRKANLKMSRGQGTRRLIGGCF